MSAVPVTRRRYDHHDFAAAADEFAPVLAAEYSADMTLVGEQWADMEAGWASADWDEMTRLLMTDRAMFGIRMGERIDAWLDAKAKKDAPDVLQERWKAAAEDRAFDRWESRQ